MSLEEGRKAVLGWIKDAEFETHFDCADDYYPVLSKPEEVADGIIEDVLKNFAEWLKTERDHPELTTMDYIVRRKTEYFTGDLIIYYLRRYLRGEG